MHGVLSLLLTFLPYFAILPAEEDVIAFQYTVIAYMPVLVMMLGIVRQVH